MRLQPLSIGQFFRPTPILFSLSLLLAACGGGGGGGSGGGGSTTGTPAAAIGTVEKIGSVKVNGVTFDCLNATVTYDDGVVDAGNDRCILASQNGELDANMHVVVTGKINDDGVTGSASSVIVKHRFKGPVANIDLTAQTFTILGQTIQVDDSTVFKIGIAEKVTGAAGLANLIDGTTVRINGIPGDGGFFLATYVKTKSIATDGNEVKGIVTAVTPPNAQIGSLTLILSGQTLPNVGDCVEAEGTLSGNTLTLKPGAAGLKIDDDCNGDSLPNGIAKAEVEGTISGFTAGDPNFKVGGQSVTISDSTTFRPAGASVADLVDGLKVEAEGSVSNGVLLAKKIKIKKNGVRIEALADSAVSGNSFTILGITVLTNGLSVGSITPGTGLRVEGFKSGPTQITATRIVSRSIDADDVTVRGPLDVNPVDPGFVILGVPVSVGVGTQFEDTTRANFFANATANTIVKAKGSESPNNTLAAREVELED